MFAKIIPALLMCVLSIAFAGAQNISVKGVVRDQKGQPVGGASVVVKGIKAGTSTDTAGHFILKVDSRAQVTVTAVGFADTTVLVEGRAFMTIVLRQGSNLLNRVVVSNTPDQSPSIAEQVVSAQIILQTLQDYAASQQMGEGVKDYSYNVIKDVNGKAVIMMERAVTTTNMGAVNYQGMLPVYHQPLKTKGSRYLLPTWSHGLVVNRYDTIINNPSYLFNVDKVTGDLMLTEDQQNYIDIDKSQVKSFALKGGYVFERVPAIGQDAYFELIAKGSRYAVYKSIKTKLVKATGQSNGLTAVGNDYDEYVDEFVYYLKDVKNNTFKTFELKKKPVRDLAPAEKEKTEKYFADHKKDDIDENFLIGYIGFLNAQ